MSTPLDWPGLAGLDPQNEARLRCEQGTWGKAPGATSDYRWLARSARFGAHLPNLQRRLRIGAEDQPRSAVAWCALPDAHFAVHFYPSQATDASGRSGFLEKQVLHWQTGGVPLPAAAAALLLLPEAADLDDDIWWGRSKDGDWTDAEFSLPIAEADCPRPRLSPAGLQVLVQEAVRELKASITFEDCRELYAQLLAEREPAVLDRRERPLSALALAALLFPMERRQADALSLTGWVPSEFYRGKDLAINWGLVVTSHQASVDIPRRCIDSASRLAEALFEDDPGRLQTAMVDVGKESASPAVAPALGAEGDISGEKPPEGESAPADAGPGAAPPDKPATSFHGEPWAVPSTVSSPMTSHEDDGKDATPASTKSASKAPNDPASEAATPAQPSPTQFDPIIALHPLPEDVPDLFRLLYEFARHINRRSLDLEAIGPLFGSGPGRVAEIWTLKQEHPLLSWIEQLERERPGWVDSMQWDFKIKQLRAVALLLGPDEALKQRLTGIEDDPMLQALVAAIRDHRDSVASKPRMR